MQVAFTRSACAAAQAGDVFRVKSLIERNPAQLHSDGCQGMALGQSGGGYIIGPCGWPAGHLLPVAYGLPRVVFACSERSLHLGHNSGCVAVCAPAGSSGYTPLHYAARENHLDVVRLLLSLGERGVVTRPAVLYVGGGRPAGVLAGWWVGVFQPQVPDPCPCCCMPHRC